MTTLVPQPTTTTGRLEVCTQAAHPLCQVCEKPLTG
jgi:hypothetical protein